MKDKKKNYKKGKDGALLPLQERDIVQGGMQRNEILSPQEITLNTGLRSTDFVLKPRKRKGRSTLQQKVLTSSQSSGSHSLTALHYFRSSGR